MQSQLVSVRFPEALDICAAHRNITHIQLIPATTEMAKQKLTGSQAARLVNKSSRTLRNWKRARLVPEKLTYGDLSKLRELASYYKQSREES
jgi:hypothetical protein